MGFAAEAGLLFWGGKGAFRPKKGCNAPSAGYGFPRKKGSTFFGGWERGRFAQKKGVTLAPSTGYRFPRKKILCHSTKKMYGEGFGIAYIHT
jgi:hypothetical protein